MRLSPSIRLVSAARTLPAIALFAGVSAANAQMKDMSDMDDARYYLLGSVGYADFNYNQSDISDVDGLSPDNSDVTVRGGLGIKISDVSAFEIALSDLGSPVQTDNIAAVLTSKVDTELDEVFEFSVVTQFDTGSAYKPIGRIGFFSFDGNKTDGEDLLIGVGVQRENLRFEIQRYDFDVAPINTVSFTYMYPFSD
jgi:hypothetical protein